MFGKSLSEYVSFLKGILILITVVYGLRLGLSLASLPDATVRWVSVTGVLVLGVLYSAWAVHARGFGGYKQLYGLMLVQGLYSQVLVALAIALAILTGRDNIFTAPEFSPPNAGKTWFHAGAHVLGAGLIVYPLLGWLIGSLVLALTRKLQPAAAK